MTLSEISSLSSELSSHGEYLTTHSVIKMILSYAIPIIVAELAQIGVSFLSAYYQM